jgi:hypothetical protein
MNLNPNLQAQPATPGPIGITANDVNSQNMTARDPFEFSMRGGITNTVAQAASGMTQQLKFQETKKRFEQLMQQQIDGAKQFYEQAKQKYQKQGDDITNWIPTPELFVDDQTGAFMPMKYYEAASKGIQEFEKNKTETNKAQADIAAHQSTAAYQQGELAIGQQKAANEENYQKGMLDYRGKEVGIQEGKALTDATKASEDIRKNKQDEQNNLTKSIRDRINEANKNIIELIGKKNGAYDPDEKQKIQKEIDAAKRNMKGDRANLMHLKPYLSDEAINKAIDIQDKLNDEDNNSPTLQRGIGNVQGTGVTVPTTTVVSRMAREFKDFADEKGATTPDGNSLSVQDIENMVQAHSDSPEDIAQAIIEMSGNKK